MLVVLWNGGVRLEGCVRGAKTNRLSATPFLRVYDEAQQQWQEGLEMKLKLQVARVKGAK